MLLMLHQYFANENSCHWLLLFQENCKFVRQDQSKLGFQRAFKAHLVQAICWPFAAYDMSALTDAKPP